MNLVEDRSLAALAASPGAFGRLPERVGARFEQDYAKTLAESGVP